MLEAVTSPLLYSNQNLQHRANPGARSRSKVPFRTAPDAQLRL